MYEVQHKIADPHRYRHQESEAACIRSYTRVPTHIDAGIKEVKLHVSGLTQADPHRYRHQGNEAVMYKVMHTSADPHRCRH
jgi:hypothetical protein